MNHNCHCNLKSFSRKSKRGSLFSWCLNFCHVSSKKTSLLCLHITSRVLIHLNYLFVTKGICTFDQWDRIPNIISLFMDFNLNYDNNPFMGIKLVMTTQKLLMSYFSHLCPLYAPCEVHHDSLKLQFIALVYWHIFLSLCFQNNLLRLYREH